jgi:hypothetical protein
MTVFAHHYDDDDENGKTTKPVEIKAIGIICGHSLFLKSPNTLLYNGRHGATLSKFKCRRKAII